MSHADILAATGLTGAELAGGTLAVRTPIDGTELARLRVHDAAAVAAMVAASRAAFAVWRDVPAPRRGELVRLLGEELRAGQGRRSAALVTPRSRQDPAGGPRRGAGDDRHLRLRRRPVAPALRPDHRLRAPRPPHARDLAPAGVVRRHHRLQLPRRAVGLERGAGPGLRRPGDLEAVGEDAADCALATAADLRARAGPLRRRAGRPARRWSSAGARPARRWSADPRRAARLRHRLDPHGPGGRAAWSPRASAAASWSSAATTP